MDLGEFDFGGDATDYKCQVRHNERECPARARFSVMQGPSNTERLVCTQDLADAVRFITKRGGAYVTRLETNVNRAGRHATEGGE